MKATARSVAKMCLVVLVLGAATVAIILVLGHPKIPVEVTFSKVGIGMGARTINGFSDNTYPVESKSVAGVIFANKTLQPLAIDIKVSSPVSQKSRSSQMVLQPNTWQELGRRQGWEFAAEDEITINSAGYRQRRFTISP